MLNEADCLRRPIVFYDVIYYKSFFMLLYITEQTIIRILLLYIIYDNIL